jgi:hypothetical protein
MDKAIKILRNTGQVLACLATVFFLSFMSFFAGEAHLSVGPLEWVLVLLILALGLLLMWWHDLPAGIFLFTISAGVWARLYGDFVLNRWLINGLLFAIAGLLFIIAWLLSLKHGELKRSASPS